jgi:aryl-alcohol dehydrogenase (NADP+)
MMFGVAGNPDHDECIRMTRTALDAGINFIDTADRYSTGESEEIVGKAIKGRRDDVVVATKFHGPMGPDRNQQGGSRRWIVRAVEDSLRRLDTEWIDVYQQHRPDWDTDPEETLSALSDLVHQGKIRVIGTSTFPAERIVEMQWISQRRGLERVRCEQPPYSIFTRSIERAILPACARYGMGVIVWSPLNGGWLAGRYRKGEAPPEGSRAARRFVSSRRWSESNPAVVRKLDLVEELRSLAAGAAPGVALTHLAHAFVLEHPAVTSAIIGPRTPEQLADALAGVDVRLSTDTLDAIDGLCPPGSDVDPADMVLMLPWMDAARRRRG